MGVERGHVPAGVRTKLQCKCCQISHCVLKKYPSALCKVCAGNTVLVRKLNPIRHEDRRLKEARAFLHDDSFIPAEEGRRDCQRREEATWKESQEERNDKRNIVVIKKRKRESVFKNRKCLANKSQKNN